MPASFFDREVKIKTPDQMFEKLRERTGGKLQPEREDRKVPPALPVAASTPLIVPSTPGAAVASESSSSTEDSRPRELEWGEPVKGDYPRATQTSLDGRYQIRRIDTRGRLLYYAWSQQAPIPKLLGYPPTAEQARALCQEHFQCATSSTSTSSTSCSPSPTSQPL